MPALICGSLAFDTITTFPGRFAEQILPDQVHILNVSFLVPTLRREFGGCAGNIAYTLQALGGAPVVMAALGNDGGDYLARLAGWGVDTSLVRSDAEHLHGAGDHHHRHRQQPDHRLPPRRDAERARDRRAARGADLDDRHHRARRPRRDVAARRPDAGRRHPLHLRPRPAAAAVRRRRAAPLRRAWPAGWRSTTTKAACCASAPA